MARSLVIISLALVGEAADSSDKKTTTTCGNMKEMYKQLGCCGQPSKESGFQIVPDPKHGLSLSKNRCDGMKQDFPNVPCTEDVKASMEEAGTDVTSKSAVVAKQEQSGTDVSEGYTGTMDAQGVVPIESYYFKSGLCPVNVHWHLGAEHKSTGEYDEDGTAPRIAGKLPQDKRRLAKNPRYGWACHHYDANDAKFTTEYNWQHCVDMHVGETYEVHWPHSSIGACHTPYQYQTPFYDGVFCGWNDNVSKAVFANNASGLALNVGVQGQIFVIVNDEDYYYPDLIRGAIVDGDFWDNVAVYTGSTTGTTRNNEMCSQYTPITWQVDRKCHLISASTFDKMCADMKQQADDMSDDLHAHGARVTVLTNYAANNFRDFKK